MALHCTQGHGSVVLALGLHGTAGDFVRARSLPTVASAKAGPAADRILLLKYGVFTLALIGLPAGLTARALSSARSGLCRGLRLRVVARRRVPCR